MGVRLHQRHRQVQQGDEHQTKSLVSLDQCREIFERTRDVKRNSRARFEEGNCHPLRYPFVERRRKNLWGRRNTTATTVAPYGLDRIILYGQAQPSLSFRTVAGEGGEKYVQASGSSDSSSVGISSETVGWMCMA